MSIKKIPPQTVRNRLEVSDVPNILTDLNRLKRVLISRRILFKNVSIMLKVVFSKLKGSICNMPINLADTNFLPYGADSNGLVVVKLERKLNCLGMCFEAVHPETVSHALLYLRQKSALYSDTEIVLDQVIYCHYQQNIRMIKH